ncbi:hypothetical protein IF1G_05770 [Cordyceps javanica]|uniref:Uncharacterized protein n=1 Tax=Cordyceps javanica TaxID=43265 RepID=A0A545VYQ5_9HYPO|nr:hypothetical protein IF1G_05770 [Cordyceps javanica]TQW06857.1 hypothetical protein IF2G_05241 [Cordyceps javanica]
MKFALLSLVAVVSAVGPRDDPPNNTNPVQTGGETTPTGSLTIMPIVSFTPFPTSGSDSITIPIITSDSTHTTHPFPPTSESSSVSTSISSSTEGSSSSSSSRHSSSSAVTSHNSTTSGTTTSGNTGTRTSGSTSSSRTATPSTTPSSAAAAAATANIVAGIAAIAGLVMAA